MSDTRKHVVQDPAQDHVEVSRYVEMAKHACLANSLVYAIRTTDATTVTVDENDTILHFNGVDADVTVNLPPANTVPGKVVILKDVVPSDPKVITITPSAPDTIEGVATYDFAGPGNAYDSRHIYSDGVSEWHIIGQV